MQTILFDLDGTLINHFTAITHSINHAERVLGLPETLNSTPTELHDQLLRECGAAAPRGGKYGTLQHAAGARA